MVGWEYFSANNDHTIIIPKSFTVNQLAPNAPFLYPLNTSENLTVFCFQGVQKGCIGNEWVSKPKKRLSLKAVPSAFP